MNLTKTIKTKGTSGYISFSKKYVGKKVQILFSEDEIGKKNFGNKELNLLLKGIEETAKMKYYDESLRLEAIQSLKQIKKEKLYFDIDDLRCVLNFIKWVNGDINKLKENLFEDYIKNTNIKPKTGDYGD